MTKKMVKMRAKTHIQFMIFRKSCYVLVIMFALNIVLDSSGFGPSGHEKITCKILDTLQLSIIMSQILLLVLICFNHFLTQQIYVFLVCVISSAFGLISQKAKACHSY